MAELPRELEMFLECRAHGALYEAGGLANQPAVLWQQMNAAYDVWRAMSEWKAAKNRAEWCEKNPQEWKIVQLVIRLREAEKGDAE